MLRETEKPIAFVVIFIIGGISIEEVAGPPVPFGNIRKSMK